MLNNITEIQAVVFSLNLQEYGLEINHVQEIVVPPQITKLPNTPEYVLGIINLREIIIPLIDLKLKILNEKTLYTDQTRVLVMETDRGRQGLIVDAVSEVIKIPNECIIQPQVVRGTVEDELLYGVANMSNRILLLFAADKLMESQWDQ